MSSNRAAARSSNPSQKLAMQQALLKAADKKKSASPGEVVGDVAANGIVQLTPAAKNSVVSALPAVDTASCVKALEKAVGFGKTAFYLEVSVAMSVFAQSSTGADLATKRVVMEIYSQAGFDVAPGKAEIHGRDYKTVSRRINASASLFEKMGKESVLKAMQAHRGGKAIDALSLYLSNTYNFPRMSALLEYVAKPADPEKQARLGREPRNAEAGAAAVGVGARMTERKTAQQAQQGQQQQAQIQPDLIDDDGIIVSAGPLSIVVPRSCTPADIRAMATKLDEFAARMEAEIGTPEEQRDRALHN